MMRREVVFTEPGRVELREGAIPAPGEGEVLVRALTSAISAGTELLFYRGDLPEGVTLDESLPSLRESFRYPSTYGYACVGEVVDGDDAHRGKRVFGFQPHVSHYVAPFEALYEVPDGLTNDEAALWPTAETAVNLVLDARPLVGERVLVVGQGVVGLLATCLLSRFPLERLFSVEPLAARRDVSLRSGADRALAPDEARELAATEDFDFDLVLELSGTGSGLNLAIASAGFEARIVVGSWYGKGAVPVDLATHFHRGRIQIQSSQVSHIGSPHLSRWTKRRRMRAAEEVLAEASVGDLITHRVPIERVAEAYELVDRRPSECLQVLLTYT